MMTDEQLGVLCAAIGERMVGLYAKCCEQAPKVMVITGLTGGLAACATEAGVSRDQVLAALNSAFDDIEAE